MRAARCLTCLLLAACGDNPATVDAPESDAPPDAPPVKRSRVWVSGDFLVDQQSVVGSFIHGEGALPFGPASPPPVRISSPLAFDARDDKIAYVSDATAPGRLDLHIATPLNSGPMVVIQGGVLDVEIDSLAISPDGTKVAFTRDSMALNGGFDLYVAPLTPGAAAVKVSPDRPGGAINPDQQDVSTIAWSPDSKYVAFIGDLTENTYEQVYVVDTAAASPAATEVLARADIATQAGLRGVQGAPYFDSANNLYFRARIQAGETQLQLFKVPPGGARAVFALPMRGDGSTPDAGAFAITPDGAKLVFSADAPTIGQYNLYTVALASPSVPTRLTMLAAAGNPNPLQPMAFSPDGTKVAVIADYLAGDTNDELFVVQLDATDQAPRRLVNVAASCGGCTGADAAAAQWTADGSAIYVRGDLTTNNETRVFLVDPAKTDQAPTLAVTAPAGGNVLTLQVRGIP